MMLPILINRFKSKKISKLIIIHCIMTAITLLYLYIVLSHFFPFSMYTRYIKLLIVVVLFVVIFSLLFIIYWFGFDNRCDQVRKLWLHLLFALFFSFTVNSLVNAYVPLFPAQHKMIIRTNDQIGFRHINREHINGYMELSSPTAFEYIGEWNRENGILVHQVRDIGAIIYEETDYVTNGLIYHLIFVPQISPASIQVEQAGQIDEVHIPGSETSQDLFIYPIKAPEFTPTSSFWEMWVTTFPILRLSSLFVFYLSASIFIQTRRIDLTKKVVSYSLLIILSFLFFTALLFQNKFINFQNFNFYWLLAAILFVIFFPIFILIVINKYPSKKIHILLLLVFLALSLRIYWVLMVPSGQVSDFGLFHNWALQIAAGEPGITITKHATFTRFVSLIYQVYPSDQAFKGFNIFFSLLTMVSIWLIGKTIDNEEIGIIAAYLFAINPSQIGMVSIVCSDIFATSFLSLTVLLLLLFVTRLKTYFLLGATVVFGIMVAIRAPMIIYLPMFLISFVPFRFNLPLGTSIGKLLIIMISFSAGFLFIRGIASTVKVEGMQINEDKNVIGPLLMGTNIESLGRHNLYDEALMENWKGDEIIREGLAVLYERLTQHPLEFSRMLKHKYAYMFGNATYVADIAFLGEDMNYSTFTTNWPYGTAEIRNAVGMIGQYFFVLTFFLAIGVCFLPRRIHARAELTFLLIILSSLLAYTFFEVQPRYFRPIVPYLVIFASMSIQAIFSLVIMRSKTQNQLDEEI